MRSHAHVEPFVVQAHVLCTRFLDTATCSGTTQRHVNMTLLAINAGLNYWLNTRFERIHFSQLLRIAKRSTSSSPGCFLGVDIRNVWILVVHALHVPNLSFFERIFNVCLGTEISPFFHQLVSFQNFFECDQIYDVLF